MKTIFAADCEKDKNFPSLVSLFSILTGPQDEGLKYSVCSLLQLLLDRRIKEDLGFFTAFYSFAFRRLIESLAISPEVEFKFFPLELVTYFVKRGEPFILLPKNGLLEKAGEFMASKTKHVQLGGVKLMKEVVAKCDDTACTYIGRLNLLQPLLRLIGAIHKDCLLVGTIRGLLRCISIENKIKLFSNFETRYKDFKPIQLHLFPELADIMRKCSVHPSTGMDKRKASQGLAMPLLTNSSVLPMFYQLCKGNIELVHKRAHEEKTSSHVSADVCEDVYCVVEDMKLSNGKKAMMMLVGKNKKKKTEIKQENYGDMAEVAIEINHSIG